MDLDEKSIIKWLLEKIEQLVITDSSDLREQIDDFCGDLFNDQYELYTKLRPELLEIIDEISGMHEIEEGNYESKILHMSIPEVEPLLERLRKIDIPKE